MLLNEQSDESSMKNAPLIEIVAEVRWGNGRSQGQTPTLEFGFDESYFVRLGMFVGRHGYQQLERVHPEGVPAIAGSVVYRYRKVDGDQNSLFQFGPGVFTANGLPPYNSWREFRPVIEQGINSLWELGVIAPGNPVEVHLRYIDAFKKIHIGDIGLTKFFSDFLGVAYRPTKVVAEREKSGEVSALRFLVSHQLQTGESLVIDAGLGSHAGESAILTNMIAKSSAFSPTTAVEVLAAFEPLHELLHDQFFELVDRCPEMKEKLGA